MTKQRPPLTSTAISSISQIAKLTTNYPAIASAHYKLRFKGDQAKVSTAVERDDWRYEKLPAKVKNSGTDIDLANLEKLVQWKITHGHSRPFLPAMIRKNDKDTVKKVTAEGARKLIEVLKPAHKAAAVKAEKTKNETLIGTGRSLYEAIETFCQLTGVGPATGSLIASVYAPDHVPFFADETYAWLVENGQQSKLKYNKKEYLALVDAVAELQERLGGGSVQLGCVDIEKAAFVAMHMDLIDDTQEQTQEADDDGEAEAEAETKTPVAIKQTAEGKRKVKGDVPPTRHSKRVKR